MTIKTKLALLLGVLLMFFTAYFVFMQSGLHTVKVGGGIYKDIILQKDLVADILPPPEYIIEAKLTVHEMLEALETGDQAGVQAAERTLKRLEQEFVTREAFWKKALAAGPTREHMRAAAGHAHRFFAVINEQLLPQARAGSIDAAKQLARGPLKEAYQQHRAEIDQVVALANKQSAEFETSANARIQTTTALLLFFGITLVAGLTIAAVLILRNSVFRPLDTTAVLLQAMGEGRLNNRIEIGRQDEIGDMWRVLSATQSHLAEILRGIRDGANQLASAAEELAQGSGQIENAANEQAEGAVSIASTTEQIKAGIDQIAGNAFEARAISTKSGETSQHQPAGTKCGHRGRTRWRTGAWLCGRGRRGPQTRRAHRAIDWGNHGHHRAHPGQHARCGRQHESGRGRGHDRRPAHRRGRPLGTGYPARCPTR